VTDEPGVRGSLQAERRSALARIASLEREFADLVAAAEAANADDEHDPEGATIAFERQHIAALLSLAQQQLSLIDAALLRVDSGTYGSCIRCGTMIPAERIAARPSAATCVDCAAKTR
jgi:DnaK suppressor protein